MVVRLACSPWSWHARLVSMDREEVRLKLRESSRAAWEACAGAARRFDEVKRAVPQGVPLPDEARNRDIEGIYSGASGSSGGREARVEFVMGSGVKRLAR